MSKTSLASGSLFRHALRRYWPLWLCVACVWLLLYVLPLVSALTAMDDDFAGVSTAQAETWYAALALSALVVFVTSILVAVFLNERLFSPKAATFYGSAPIARRSLFGTAVLTGLAVQAAIEAVVAALLLAATAPIAAISAPMVAGWFGFVLACTFVMTAMAQLACEVSGSGAVAVVLYILANVLALCIACAAYLLGEAFLYGVGGAIVSTDVAEWLSPLVALADFSTDVDPASNVIGVNWLPVGIYCLVAVALLALAFWLDGRRDAETAGEAVSFAVLGPVLKYLAGACAALLLGAVVVVFFLRDSAGTLGVADVVAIAVAMVAGAFLGLLFAQMALQRSSHVMSSIWKGLLVLACACILLVAGFAADPAGVVARVPATDDVESAEISVQGGALGSLSSQEGIDSIRDLQQDIVSTRWERAAEVSGAGDTDSVGSADVLITYHLKDGSVLLRSYDLSYVGEVTGDDFVPTGTAADILAQVRAIVDSREAKISVISPAMAADSGYEVEITFYGADSAQDADVAYDASGTVSGELTGSQARDFVCNAMAKDIDGLHNDSYAVLSDSEVSKTELDVQVVLYDKDMTQVFMYWLDAEKTPNSISWVEANYPNAEIYYSLSGKEFRG